jgi:hypothetical protein
MFRHLQSLRTPRHIKCYDSAAQIFVSLNPSLYDSLGSKRPGYSASHDNVTDSSESAGVPENKFCTPRINQPLEKLS